MTALGDYARGITIVSSPVTLQAHVFARSAFVPRSLHQFRRLQAQAKTVRARVVSTKMNRGATPSGARPLGPDLFSINVRQWTRTAEARDPRIHVSEPYEVTYFSRSSDRTVSAGNRDQLKLFEEPSLNVRLDEGYETFRPKVDDQNSVGIEPVVQTLDHAGFDMDNQVDIVTFRNNLNKIALTPYNDRDAWEIDAVRVDGTVYLDIRKLDEPAPDERHKRFMYMGYRFEALCTGGQSDKQPVDANEEFCSLVRIRIGQHRIVACSEMDAVVQGTEETAKPKYIELKTMKRPESGRDYTTLYSSRYLKWYVQSFLAGVGSIFVGMRNQSGELVEVDRLKTRALPSIARDGLQRLANDAGQRRCHIYLDKIWEPFVCLNFLDMFMHEVRDCCRSRPGVTVRITYHPRTREVRAFEADDGSVFADRVRAVKTRPRSPDPS